MLRWLLVIFFLSANINQVHSAVASGELRLQQEKPKAYYKSGSLVINNLKGECFVQIYSIIGNKLFEKQVPEIKNAEIAVELKGSDIYIIRVLCGGEYHSLKIFVQ